MWVKVDDQFHAHPKAQEAWQASEASIGLHLLALSHAGCYLTDGRVSEAFVANKVPSAAKRKKVVGVLVMTGLWEVDPKKGGWQIHDYLKYNPSREMVEKDKEWDRRRKELHRDPDLVAAIRARDGNRCRYCNVKVNWRDRRSEHGGTYDHVVPRGENTLENVVVACRSCNFRKGARTPDQAGMELSPVQNGVRSGLDPVRSELERV